MVSTVNDLQFSSVDFENISDKFDAVRSSPDYQDFCQVLDQKTRIVVIGNGGLHFVAAHMACDISRLVPGKSVQSFDSVGFITSNANDYGYDNIFTRWLDTTILPGDEDHSMIIGLSCSGRSRNVINALNWATAKSIPAWLISGSQSPEGINTLNFNCKYYHTVEALSLMLFYDMIHKVGHKCPTIENNYADSELRKTI